MEKEYIFYQRLRFWDLYRLLLFLKTNSWKKKMMIGFVYALILAGFVESIFSFQENILIINFFQFGFLLVLSFFWMFFIFTFITTIAFIGILNERKFLVNHWGIIISGKKSETAIPWRKSFGFTERKSYLLIFISDKRYIVILKRVFKKSDEFNAFKSFVKNAIENSVQ
jgi:hypothetical protein